MKLPENFLKKPSNDEIDPIRATIIVLEEITLTYQNFKSMTGKTDFPTKDILNNAIKELCNIITRSIDNESD